MPTIPCDTVQEYEVPPGLPPCLLKRKVAVRAGTAEVPSRYRFRLAGPSGYASPACRRKNRRRAQTLTPSELLGRSLSGGCDNSRSMIRLLTG